MHYLTRDELKRLFKAAEVNSLHLLAFKVSVFHGLRISELVALRGSDVADGYINVRRLKGSNDTLQRLHPECADLTALAASKPHQRLFKFTRQYADRLIKYYGALAGLNLSKCHWHALKHSTAMLIWDELHAPGDIQAFLGHVSMSSTMVYLREESAERATKALHAISI